MQVLLGAWFALALLAAGLAAAARADAVVVRRVSGLGAVPAAASRSRRPTGLAAGRLVRSRLFDAPAVASRLVAAGLPEDLLGHARRKLRWTAAGALAGAFAGGRVGLALVPLLALAGFRWPDFALARRAGARRRALARQAPALVEILAACVAAGRSPPAALGIAARRLGGPLGEELRRAASSVELGERWRDALAELVRRVPVTVLRRLERTLAQSERLGASLAATLRELGRDGRVEQRLEIETRARAAPVKLLFPLVFLILPAFLLLTVVPVVLGTLRGFE